MRVSLGLYGLQDWFGGDFAGILDLMKIADRKGVDQVSITDHVVMGENIDRYPYGPFLSPLTFPWYEPLTVLSTIAGATERIRLSAGILISPLRPAVLFAKQLATLDVMSRGRVEMGIGTGWQKEEYDASGIDFDKRYRVFDEQIRVARALWAGSPVSFEGQTVKLDRIHQWPQPVQKRLPLWMGIAPTPRNCKRIAELGDGWIPIVQDPAQVKEGVSAIKAAFDAAGRDFTGFEVRAMPNGFGPDGAPNLDFMLSQVPAMRDAGATMIEFLPLMYCRGPQDFEPVVDKVLSAIKG
ncbi:MAG: TIGR03619 family F420-dependent LLM class oxidoreductase [Proteobacteria bacterium]|nr:TIGR03619 family F420-dependent LLM class oxidoreductase [Pseudomonadota bacterium]HQR03565.1 TIGR03619 family F420-dependent LLM class oxidoreductase [Rhodocyclaceae bacterium]